MNLENPPRVSVILPAFNAEGTIALAIESVLAQSVSDFELIICDDGSTDSTPGIVSRFSDTRIRFIRSQRNIGPGPARDLAISKARSPLIAFLDADDAWLPERLAILLRHAEDHPFCLIFDDIFACRFSEGRFFRPRRIHGVNGFERRSQQEMSLAEFLASDRLLIQPLIPTDIVRSNSIAHGSERFGEDAVFYIKLGLAGLRFFYVPLPLYVYRVSPTSLTTTTNDTGMMRRTLEQFLSYRADEDFRDALCRKLDKLQSDESLYLFRTLVGRRRYAEALVMMRNPSLLLRGVQRTIRKLQSIFAETGLGTQQSINNALKLPKV